MLLTALKVVAFIWLGVLVIGIAVLMVLYVFDLSVRAIRRSFVRRR
jgi:hypothetical protein